MYVLDTNVLVAALWSRSGASFRIVELVLQGKLKVAVSVALALEYESVLTREAMRDASWASQKQLDSFLDVFLAKAELTMPIRTQIRPALPDPADDMVLECAIQAGAEAIVTMNVRDFAPARKLYRVQVLKPGELMAGIGDGR